MEERTIWQRVWQGVRPYWMWFAAPFIGLLLVLVILLLFTESSIVAPFVYLLF